MVPPGYRRVGQAGRSGVGFFKRSATPAEPFWRVRPIRSADPGLLYQHGISCISHDDGKGAMATGWAIWDLAGLHEHQAWDFLTDGYRIWRKARDDEQTLAVEFLTDLLGRLASLPPAPWPDLYSVPPELVQPIATLHTARCWAASELLETLEPSSRGDWEQRVYDAITSARHEFVPPRSMSFARSYAATHGLSEPWA